jgi:hypothetical protein
MLFQLCCLGLASPCTVKIKTHDNGDHWYTGRDVNLDINFQVKKYSVDLNCVAKVCSDEEKRHCWFIQRVPNHEWSDNTIAWKTLHNIRPASDCFIRVKFHDRGDEWSATEYYSPEPFPNKIRQFYIPEYCEVELCDCDGCKTFSGNHHIPQGGFQWRFINRITDKKKEYCGVQEACYEKELGRFSIPVSCCNKKNQDIRSANHFANGVPFDVCKVQTCVFKEKTCKSIDEPAC